MSSLGWGGGPCSTLEILTPSPPILGGPKITQSTCHMPTTTINTLSVFSPSWQGDRGDTEADEANLERVELEDRGLSCLWVNAVCGVVVHRRFFLALLLTSQNQVVVYITVGYL